LLGVVPHAAKVAQTNKPTTSAQHHRMFPS